MKKEVYWPVAADFAEQIKKSLRNALSNPTAVIVFSFLIVIILGTFFLSLPIASEEGQSTPFMDCLFTATAATCITGLTVVDTADHWSTFGEIVILLMFQIGGLGFITLATFFISMAGKKTGLKSMMLAQESIASFNLQETVPLVRQILMLVFIIEFIGAVILSAGFIPQFGLKGIYFGIFHSVSAFCNAGYDLMGGAKSMYDFNNRPLILYTIDALVIVGGLGFIVWKDLLDYRKNKKLLIHTKIVLYLSAILLVFGTLFIFFVEYDNALDHLSVSEKINASVFLSVNTRSGGYTSIDINTVHPVTKAFLSLMMTIGGASGSTAGGIKINTLGIMLVAIYGMLRKREETVIMKKRIPPHIVIKSFTVAFLVTTLILIITFVINLMHPELSLLDCLFEATAAGSTAGMSTGITRAMNPLGKLLMIMSMFAGRVGPISFALAFSLARKGQNNTIYPDGKFVVG